MLGVHVPTEELWGSLEVDVQVFVSCQVFAEEPDLGSWKSSKKF